uniref:Uncharacterized protein n=1 Tax=Arundo donax TaxID=35708 RepID=A0A0A9AM43_ARUDO
MYVSGRKNILYCLGV